LENDMVVAAVAVGAAVVGGVASSVIQSDSARRAAHAQGDAALAGIDEQRYQFDKLQELYKPYIDAGTGALTGQQDILGTNGNTAQQSAISQLQNSPQFAALTQQGENSILQNASATGGLRGGNTQAALAQFRPQLLSELINQQYSRLGGLTSLGQASAAGQAAAGQNTANSISDLLAQRGAAQAGNAIAQGQAWSNGINSVTSAIGSYAGMGGGGKF
jgi:hypothetical protein